MDIGVDELPMAEVKALRGRKRNYSLKQTLISKTEREREREGRVEPKRIEILRRGGRNEPKARRQRFEISGFVRWLRQRRHTNQAMEITLWAFRR